MNAQEEISPLLELDFPLEEIKAMAALTPKELNQPRSPITGEALRGKPIRIEGALP